MSARRSLYGREGGLMGDDYQRGPGPGYKPPRIEPNPSEGVAERGRAEVLAALEKLGIRKNEDGRWVVDEPIEENTDDN